MFEVVKRKEFKIVLVFSMVVAIALGIKEGFQVVEEGDKVVKVTQIGQVVNVAYHALSYNNRYVEIVFKDRSYIFQNYSNMPIKKKDIGYLEQRYCGNLYLYVEGSNERYCIQERVY